MKKCLAIAILGAVLVAPGALAQFSRSAPGGGFISLGIAPEGFFSVYDGRYVNVAGDDMAGALSVPSLRQAPTSSGGAELGFTRNGLSFGAAACLAWTVALPSDAVTATICAGSGSPEGAVSANAGSIYLRLDGGSGTTLYAKESGSGSTGWIAK